MRTIRLMAAAAYLAAARPAPAAGPGIEWITIPGGAFEMGSKPGLHADRDGIWSNWPANESPPHRVEIKSFKLAKSPVTVGQYRACVSAGACTPSACSDKRFIGDDQPVICVDWYQARAFSKWAGGRLPSEAEWEYAARSLGKDQHYPWGNEIATCERAVMASTTSYKIACGRGATWPVCSKPAGNTEQGLCDMAGLVWQWTQDWYHDSYEGAPIDGSAWETPAGFMRVARGGAFNDQADALRASHRGSLDPAFRGRTMPNPDALGPRIMTYLNFPETLAALSRVVLGNQRRRQRRPAEYWTGFRPAR